MEDLTRKAQREEELMALQLSTSRGPTVLGLGSASNKNVSSSATSRTAQQRNPTLTSRTGPMDSWIFEPFPDSTSGADIGTALILMSTLPKANIEPFDGDPKNWPIFIQTFKSMIHDITPLNAQRIGLLRGMLDTNMQRKYSRILGNPLNYQQALQDLWTFHGQPHLVVQKYIEDLRDIPLLKEGDVKALGDFQQRVHGAICSLEAAGYGHELNSSIALADLVIKLPRTLASKWGYSVNKWMKSDPTATPNLHKLDSWLLDAVMAENYIPRPAASTQRSGPAPVRSFTFGGKAAQPSHPKHTDSSQSTSAAVRAITSNSREDSAKGSSADRDAVGCQVCHDPRGHALTNCNAFMGMTPTERVKTLVELRNCYRCLGRFHSASTCKKVEIFCTALGCGGKHHPLIHGGENDSRQRDASSGIKN